jgi:hypothetical protein
MKKIVKQIFVLFLLAALFASCKKDENKVYYEGGTAPVLSTSVTSPDLPLSYADRDKEALKLTWTNPEYKFNTGVSSQDVNYQIEIDTAGANFKNPKRQTISVSKELSKTFKVAEFNGFLLNQLQLDTSVVHNIEIRVTSFLTNQSVALNSNVLKYTVVPYPIPPVVNPPSTGELFLVGSATAGDWSNPVPLPSQEFTKKDALHYEITIPLTGGKEYLFIPLNGNWDHKFACASTADQSPDGGEFGFDLPGNFPGPIASGTYKIEVDFQRGRYSVTKL